MLTGRMNCVSIKRCHRDILHQAISESLSNACSVYPLNMLEIKI